MQSNFFVLVVMEDPEDVGRVKDLIEKTANYKARESYHLNGYYYLKVEIPEESLGQFSCVMKRVVGVKRVMSCSTEFSDSTV